MSSSSKSDSSPSSPESSGPSTPPSAVSDIALDGEKKNEEVLVEEVEMPESMLQGLSRAKSSWPSSFPEVPVHVVPEGPAEADVSTPDNWVKRNPDLVRLTGKHPFNSEARLNKLFEAGFLTPSHLFYVRNHGAVPRVTQELANEWTLSISGWVENEVKWSLKELKEKFKNDIVTRPVTFVCAGNRRKEQNVVSKSLGFNWGAAGLSTGLFTGIPLATILEYVKPTKGAKYVIFEGTDELPNGPYGTSQKLAWAEDDRKGMLVCWAMNGLPLEPDHGFPLRMVIPGQIGGRSVKWLNKIEVSNKESQHHLHFWDNKVLPTQVTADRARKEREWWYDEKYIINELNTNSAIARPDHNEIVRPASFPTPEGDLQPEMEASSNPSYDAARRLYTLQGYAYAGGGRRVNRVEITVNEGTSWRLCSIDYPEDIFRALTFRDSAVYGKLDFGKGDMCFCWCFWSIAVPIDDLTDASSVAVRAMDESLVIQPRDMYWNATGMMNNWWFRIAIHKEEVDGRMQLRFEHPTLAGTASGGWMERMKQSGLDPLKPVFKPESSDRAAVTGVSTSTIPEEIPLTKPDITRIITHAELEAAKEDKNSAWFVVRGEVYDGTGFLNEHPGGADSILLVKGEDATEDFIAIHSPEGRLKLAQFHIGTLEKTSPSQASAPIAAPVVRDTFLQKSAWSKAVLSSKVFLTHDTVLLKFDFSSKDGNGVDKLPLGLPCGQHAFARLKRKDTGEVVQRAYTPVSKFDQIGSVELLIKLYFPTSAFPTGGKMTTGFHLLEVGDDIEFKGPLGSFVWTGQGTAVWRGVERKMKRIGLICGGSGITPILQVIRGVFHDQSDTTTQLWVLTSNKTEADILCREELDDYSKTHPDRYRVYHTIGSIPPDSAGGWKGGLGRINDEMLRLTMPPPPEVEDPDSEGTLVLVCGPEGMIEGAVKPGLKRLGWDVESSLVVF